MILKNISDSLKKNFIKFIKSSKMGTEFLVQGSYLSFNTKNYFSWNQVKYEYIQDSFIKTYMDMAASKISVLSSSKILSEGAGKIVGSASPALVVMTTEIVCDVYNHYSASIDDLYKINGNIGFQNLESCLFDTPYEDFSYEIEREVLKDNSLLAVNNQNKMKNRFKQFARSELFVLVINRLFVFIIVLAAALAKLFSFSFLFTAFVGLVALSSLLVVAHIQKTDHDTCKQAIEILINAGTAVKTIENDLEYEILFGGVHNLATVLRHMRRKLWFHSSSDGLKKDERFVHQLKQLINIKNDLGSKNDYKLDAYMLEIKDQYQGKQRKRALPLVGAYLDLDDQKVETCTQEQIQQIEHDQAKIIEILRDVNISHLIKSVANSMLDKYEPRSMLWAGLKERIRGLVFVFAPIIKDVNKVGGLLVLSLAMLITPYLASNFMALQMFMLLFITKSWVIDPISNSIYDLGNSVLYKLSKFDKLRTVTTTMMDAAKVDDFDFAGLKAYQVVCKRANKLMNEEVFRYT